MGKLILVDACCGPCAMTALRCLEYGPGDVFFTFFNPNVHPYTEYARRRDAFREAMEMEAVEFEVLPYLPEEWWRAVAFREESRCEMCYRLRLRRAAERAAAMGLERFTTTLLASPYQDHELIGRIGETLADEMGLRFLPWDGREVYREVLQEAREKGIYTQPYCGCLLSERERYDPAFRRRGGRARGRD
jgi:predicted adenine nucleotide alpha hydrolase (AANH) superfamily ATPase